MGCGWCGGMCGRQKECPGSWQQDHCPPKITEVWLAWQGTGKGGTSWACGGGQQVLTISFFRTGMSLIATRRTFLAEESACKDVEAEKCLRQD